MLVLAALMGSSPSLPLDAIARSHGKVEVLSPVVDVKYTEDYVPFLPAQAETLFVDDGTPSGRGANGDPSWREAVQIPVSQDYLVLGILYFPGDFYGSSPPLTAYLWDDDGSGNLPGTALWGPYVDSSLTYDDWTYIDISADSIQINSGYIYPGWSDESMADTLDTLNMYWNYYDSAFNGYNYWYDGSSWSYDDFFPGDFMIRLVVEPISDVAETDGSRVSVSALRGGLLFSVPAGFAEVRVVDAAGRVVYSDRVSGTARVSLRPGIYFWRAGDQDGKAVIR